MLRRMRAALVASVISVLVLGLIPNASAGKLPENCTKVRGTIHCTEEGKNKNWTTETSKKGSFNSSHEEEKTNKNKGGNAPPGQN
jgi:hypothetical protein